MTTIDFSARLITWQKQYGRHDLPWQNTTDPYAIWVSEIMLQQTQVTAVIGYYAKFIHRFPNIAVLAKASQDDVLQHWSGLGYYSRARNLHKSAINIVSEHNGKFPLDFITIQTLPGIGRSTAAAIASFAFKQIHTILDGNVKRVLARHFCIEGWPSSPKVEKQLWSLAEELLPKNDMVAYTQGLMDLGATLCTRNKPKCTVCPVNNSCEAYKQKRVHLLPTPKPRKAIPEKHITMLIMKCGDRIMLEKRPSTGIWGGLWSFPEVDSMGDITLAAQSRFSVTAKADETLPILSHAFTHFKLHIKPQILQVIALPNKVSEKGRVWLTINEAINTGIPTPVRKILLNLKASAEELEI